MSNTFQKVVRHVSKLGARIAANSVNIQIANNAVNP